MEQSVVPRDLFSQLPAEAFISVFENVFDGVVIIEDGKLLYANPDLAAMFGYVPGEMVGKPVSDLAAPGVSAERVQQAAAASDRRVYSIEGVRKDGSQLPLEVRSLPVEWQGRRFRVVALRDLTAERPSEEKLTASEQRFRMMVETANEGVGQVDADLKVVFANPKLAHDLGYEPEEMIGRSALDFVPRVSRDAIMRNFDSRRAGMRGQYDLEYLRKDGSTVWMINSVAPLYGADGRFQGAIGLSTNIDERKQTEDLRTRVLSSSKTSALAEIANGIAHEVSNPLSVIRGYTDVLREAFVDGGRHAGADRDPDWVLGQLDKIDSTVTRITQIVRGLAVFTRDMHAEPFERLGVASLIQDALNLCECRLRAAGVELIRVPVDPELDIDCRPVPLSQVLLNLLHNAADAVETVPQRWVRIGAREEGEAVLIWVEDGGPGIAPEIRKRLMQPFQSTKPPNRGMGLGLSISRKIVESHRGTLTLDTSSPCTRFVIRLPKRS